MLSRFFKPKLSSIKSNYKHVTILSLYSGVFLYGFYKQPDWHRKEQEYRAKLSSEKLEEYDSFVKQYTEWSRLN